MLRPYRQKLSLEDAAHLLRRAAFGGTPAQIRALEGLAPEAAVEKLTTYSLEEMVENPFKPDAALKNNQEVRVTQLRWLFEMFHSPAPLRERLAFFWHGHFPIGTDKVRAPEALAQYLRTLRTHALDKFETLTLETVKTPAMLRYLDNDLNKKGKPNENLGRELFELFTLGIGHYSEADVKEAARSLTGWTFAGADKRKDQVIREFVFNAKEHDDGSKTVLGQTGKFNGADIVRIASAHSATPRFIGKKIWQAFVAPDPKEEELEDLAAVWEGSSGDMRQIMTRLLSSDTFYRRKNMVIRGPLEHAIGSARALGLPIQDEKFYQGALNNLVGLGQVPLSPPDVSGWEGGRSWISDGSLLTRMQMSAALTLGKGAVVGKSNLKDLSLALLGSEDTPHKAVLEGLSAPQQAYLMMISPEYGLI